MELLLPTCYPSERGNSGKASLPRNHNRVLICVLGISRGSTSRVCEVEDTEVKTFTIASHSGSDETLSLGPHSKLLDPSRNRRNFFFSRATFGQSQGLDARGSEEKVLLLSE